MQGVETDVAGRPRRLRNDVGGRIVRVEGGEDHRRRLEELRALVQSCGGHAVHQPGQRVHRVQRLFRIGGVPLNAARGNEQIEGTAPSVLDGVAQDFRAAGLSDEAGVRHVPVLSHPLQNLAGAVNGNALLVAGDQQRHGAGRGTAVVAGPVDRRRGEGRHLAFHVRRAPAIEHAVLDHRFEGRVQPGLGITRRHHVGVSGETQVRTGIAMAGEQIVHVRRAFLGEGQAVAGEARRRQCHLQHFQGARVLRRHGGAADQCLRQRHGVGSVRHRFIPPRRSGCAPGFPAPPAPLRPPAPWPPRRFPSRERRPASSGP